MATSAVVAIGGDGKASSAAEAAKKAGGKASGRTQSVSQLWAMMVTLAAAGRPKAGRSATIKTLCAAVLEATVESDQYSRHLLGASVATLGAVSRPEELRGLFPVLEKAVRTCPAAWEVLEAVAGTLHQLQSPGAFAVAGGEAAAAAGDKPVLGVGNLFVILEVVRAGVGQPCPRSRAAVLRVLGCFEQPQWAFSAAVDKTSAATGSCDLIATCLAIEDIEVDPKTYRDRQLLIENLATQRVLRQLPPKIADLPFRFLLGSLSVNGHVKSSEDDHREKQF
jgi:hypothetical protein